MALFLKLFVALGGSDICYLQSFLWCVFRKSFLNEGWSMAA